MERLRAAEVEKERLRAEKEQMRQAEQSQQSGYPTMATDDAAARQHQL